MNSAARLIPLLWLVGWLIGASPANAQGLDERMRSVVTRFVEKTGEQVMTVGSWVKGSFNPATSDFDMRLVIPEFNKAGANQQLARWQDAKRVLTSMIREEFGAAAADGILARTNLYAPGRLMAGIEDASEAAERFRDLKTVPSLGYNGPVNANTPIKYTEGLYGVGADTYVQGYEKSAGRLYYWKDGKCVSGLSEMARLNEGVAEAAYTAAGTANTAGQWAEHAMAELAAGRGEKVAKYLERLERDLAKSRSLNGLSAVTDLRTQIRDLRALLRDNPGKLSQVSEQVGRVLSRGRAEAAVLRGMGDAGPMRRVFCQILLDGLAAGNKVGELVDKLMAKVPEWANAESAMNCLLLYLGVKATASALGEGDALDAIAAGSAEFKWLAAFGPALLAQLYSEVLIQARAGGYQMAAGSQGAWDLMEGIYSAWGRVDVDPDPKRRMTLADLVARFQDENVLEGVVREQAQRASTRGLGAANAQADRGVAEAIVTKCWPVIREAWRWERDSLATEYLRLASTIVHSPLALTYRPNPAQAGQQVVVEAGSFDGKLGERLERMRQILVTLYGRGTTLASNYYWSAGGQAVGDRDRQRGYTFDEPGTYPVKATLAIQPITRFAKTEPRIMARREVQALVDVVVPGAPKPTAKSTLRCRLVLTGSSHWVVKLDEQTVDRRTRENIGTTGELSGPVTLTGNRFEASGGSDQAAAGNEPARSSRWTVRGTLSADHRQCLELTIEEDRTTTTRTATRTQVNRTRYTATLGPLDRRAGAEGDSFLGLGPKVKALTYRHTWTIDNKTGTPASTNGVADDYQVEGGECQLVLGDG